MRYTVAEFINNISLKIPGRINEWWHQKTPFFFAIIYASGIINKQLPPFTNIVLFFISYIGIASFGYIINDLFDRGPDSRAGKYNRLNKVSNLTIGLSIFVALVFSVLPWFWLPYFLPVYILLATELLLLLIYAIPPFRLKESGWIAVITDSLYAYAIPFTITAFLFVTTEPEFITLSLFLCWLFVIGFRNILMHYYWDFEADKISNTQTVGVKLGKPHLKRIVERLLFPVELVLGYLITLKLEQYFYYIPIIFSCYCVYSYFKEVNLFNQGIKGYKNYNFINNIVLNGFYISWLPLYLLTTLIIDNYAPWWLLVVHVMLFYKQLSNVYWWLKSAAIHGYYVGITILYRYFYKPLKTIAKQIIK